MKFARSNFVFPVMTSSLLAAAVALALTQTEGFQKPNQDATAPKVQKEDRVVEVEAPTPFQFLAHPFLNPTGHEVTLDLTNVSAQELLDALKRQNVNFVIETSDLPAGKTYSLHLTNVDESAAMSAVANAMGLMVTQQDRVFSLSRGPAMPGFFHQAPFDEFEFLPGSPFGLFDHKEMTPEQKAKFEKAMKEFELKMKDFDFKMDKDLENLFGDEGILNSEEFAKKMEEFAKNMKTWTKDFEFKLDEKDLQKLKELEKLDKSTIERAMSLNSENIEKLMESLTPEQKNLAKEKGYLLYSDLTPAQQELLTGAGFEGSFELKFKNDKGEITIRKGDQAKEDKD